MIEKYEDLINKFLLKQIPFFSFKEEIDSYLQTVHPAELQDFSDWVLDNPFVEFDPDQVMLIQLYLWFVPNRLNKLCQISGSDSMFTSFIKSVLDQYDLNFFSDFKIINNNMNFYSCKKGNVYLILNLTDNDMNIPVPEELFNQEVFCINCGDEITIEKNVELYPYGFYLLTTE